MKRHRKRFSVDILGRIRYIDIRHRVCATGMRGVFAKAPVGSILCVSFCPNSKINPYGLNFNPRPPCGGRQGRWRGQAGEIHISIHAPIRRATSARRGTTGTGRYFNPRPHAEGDTTLPFASMKAFLFQSTPPMRRATAILSVNQTKIP